MKSKILLGLFLASISIFCFGCGKKQTQSPELPNEQETTKTSEAFNSIMKKLPDTKKIIVASDIIDDDNTCEKTQCIKSVSGYNYQVIRILDDETKVKKLVDILSQAVYAEYSTNEAYKPFFQLLDSNDMVIAEFALNDLADKNSNCRIVFSKENKKILEEYIVR